MPLLRENVKQCPECTGTTFRETRVVKIRKQAKRRTGIERQKTLTQGYLEEEYYDYVCTDCQRTLDI